MNWKALGSTVPAMFALTFCEFLFTFVHWACSTNTMSSVGVLHVPINIPALGLTTGEDNVDVDRELRAHGWSNALSGLCGSIQVRLAFLIPHLGKRAAIGEGFRISQRPSWRYSVMTCPED